MPLFDENHGMINEGIICWDGITQPETVKNDDGTSYTKWTIKCIYAPNNPDIAMANELAQKCLRESKWKGYLPNGGNLPVNTLTPAEYDGRFTGHYVINFTTYRQPDVYDENGALLDPMQYGRLIYSGQLVNVLFSCKSYDNKSKGIKAQLAGFSILASRNAPRQEFGGGGIDTSKAFGSAPAQQQGGMQESGKPMTMTSPFDAPRQDHNFLGQ